MPIELINRSSIGVLLYVPLRPCEAPAIRQFIAQCFPKSITLIFRDYPKLIVVFFVESICFGDNDGVSAYRWALIVSTSASAPSPSLFEGQTLSLKRFGRLGLTLPPRFPMFTRGVMV